MATKLATSLESDLKVIDENQEWKADKSYVVISGDLSYTGDRSEYDLLRTRLAMLPSSASRDGIVAAPGNHDLERKSLWPSDHRFCSELFGDELTSLEAASDLEARFDHPGEMDRIRGFMKNYFEFVDSLTTPSPEDCSKEIYRIYHDSLDSVKTYLNFVSLNSSFYYSEASPYYGFIGFRQANAALVRAGRKGREPLFKGWGSVTVSTFHHPFAAQPPAQVQEVERLLSGRSHLILTGHVHDQKLMSYIGAAAQPSVGLPLVSSSRCVYDEHEPSPRLLSGESRMPGYSIINLTIDAQGVREGRLFSSVYRKETASWEHNPWAPWPYLVVTRGGTPALLRQ